MWCGYAAGVGRWLTIEELKSLAREVGKRWRRGHFLEENQASSYRYQKEEEWSGNSRIRFLLGPNCAFSLLTASWSELLCVFEPNFPYGKIWQVEH